MAKETITINGKVYKARELDFNFLCELADNEIELTEISKKIFSSVRVYVAYCMGVDLSIAGDEINQHIINGGKFDEIIETFNAKAEESDFFQALGNSNSKKETTKRSTKKKETEESE